MVRPAAKREAGAVIAAWAADYNTTRPHSALGYQTPAAHAAKLKAMGWSSPPVNDAARKTSWDRRLIAWGRI